MRIWLVLLLLTVAGCRGSADPLPTTVPSPLPETTVTTVTTTVPATTTTAGFEVPAVIDLPYVQRVLETIYHLDGEAARYAYAKKLVDAELYERLEAIFGGPRLSEAKRVLGENAAEGFALFANPPGDPTVRAVDIVQATSGCMVIRAALDYGPYFKEARPPDPPAVIQLGRAEVLPFNPTGWGVVVAGDPDAGTNIRVCK